MRIAVQAWRVRQAAREALEADERQRAFGLAAQAQQLHRTPGGEALRLLSAWVHAHPGATE